MTAETYLFYIAPLLLLGFGAAMYALISALDARSDREQRSKTAIANATARQQFNR